MIKSFVRTPELEGLAHQLCASYLSVCCKFIEKNKIIINSVKYARSNIHIIDNYSKNFVYNETNFIMFHCDFINNFFYDLTSADVIFRF